MVQSELTSEQRALLSKVREDWTAIGRSIEPADRRKAEHSIALAYQSAGLAPPQTVVWLGSPLAGSLGAMALTLAGRRASPSVPSELWDEFPGRGAKSVWEEVWHRLSAEVADRTWDQLSERRGPQVLAHLRPEISAQVERQFGDPTWKISRDLGRDFSSPLVGFPYQPIRAHCQAVAADRGWRGGDWELTNEQVAPCSLGQHDTMLALYARLHALGLKATGSLTALWQLARSCGWWWAFEDLAILTERPRSLSLDDQGRLHSQTGLAIEYRDGLGLYVWHGNWRIPSKLIIEPEAISFDVIEAERSSELRTAMIERYGPERYRTDLAARKPGLLWVDYEVLPGIGGPGGESPQRGTLADLVLCIPYLMPWGGPPAERPPPPIPPRVVLNSVRPSVHRRRSRHVSSSTPFFEPASTTPA